LRTGELAKAVDGVAAADYEVNLEANLLNLLGRIKSGRYHAPPIGGNSRRFKGAGGG